MAAPLEADMLALLNGVGGLVTGTNLFKGPVKPSNVTPAKSVFVQASGGPAPEHYRASTEVRRRGVQVRVRSDGDARDAGQTLAELVLATLHGAAPAGYIRVESTTSQPLYLGENEAGQHEWSINLFATIDE